MEFALKTGFWRFFAERWLPPRFRPKVSLQDVCEWINSWIASVHHYFEWVDEDLGALPDAEVAVLVDESELAYRSHLGAGPRIVFGNPLSNRPGTRTLRTSRRANPTPIRARRRGLASRSLEPTHAFAALFHRSFLHLLVVYCWALNFVYIGAHSPIYPVGAVSADFAQAIWTM